MNLNRFGIVGMARSSSSEPCRPIVMSRTSRRSIAGVVACLEIWNQPSRALSQLGYEHLMEEIVVYICSHTFRERITVRKSSSGCHGEVHEELVVLCMEAQVYAIGASVGRLCDAFTPVLRYKALCTFAFVLCTGGSVASSGVIR